MEFLTDVTAGEIDILLEALDAWVARDKTNEMMGDFIEAILIKPGEMPPDRIREKEQKKMEQKTSLKSKSNKLNQFYIMYYQKEVM